MRQTIGQIAGVICLLLLSSCTQPVQVSKPHYPLLALREGTLSIYGDSIVPCQRQQEINTKVICFTMLQATATIELNEGGDTPSPQDFKALFHKGQDEDLTPLFFTYETIDESNCDLSQCTLIFLNTESHLGSKFNYFQHDSVRYDLEHIVGRLGANPLKPKYFTFEEPLLGR